MTYIVSAGALNSTHSLTVSDPQLIDLFMYPALCYWHRKQRLWQQGGLLELVAYLSRSLRLSSTSRRGTPPPPGNSCTTRVAVFENDDDDDDIWRLSRLDLAYLVFKK